MIKIEPSKTDTNRFVLCLGKTLRFHVSRLELIDLVLSGIDSLVKSEKSSGRK